MLANLLTTLRLVIAIPVALAFALPGSLDPKLHLTLIVMAIASDFADGKVARHYGTASNRGMLFDHATDFLFVSSALAGLAYNGNIEALLPILIIIAFSQYVLDSYLLFKQKHLRMSLLGRWNGILYFLPIVLFANAALPMYPESFQQILSSLATASVLVLSISTMASIVDRTLAPKKRSNA